jgi:hypothetical protein
MEKEVQMAMWQMLKCQEKKVYVDRSEAEAVLAQMRAQGTAGPHFCVYRCRACGLVHLGRDRRRRRKQ